MQRPTFHPTLVIVVAILGFLLALAFNTARGLSDVRASRARDLVDVVRDLEYQRDELQERLVDLRGRMNTFEREAAADAGMRESFTAELESVRAAAGLTLVEGPGVEVTLADSSQAIGTDDPNDYLVHDTDIAAVVNALFVGGAEAVEVNGERVVATTPVRCAGTTILVNSVRLGGPYVVRAIGDPMRLEDALAEDPVASLLFTTYRVQYGLEVTLTRADRLQVAPFLGSVRPEYAISAGEGNG